MSYSRKVLIIDDEINFLEQCEEKLKDLGYKVQTAINGDIALELFQKYSYPVVLTDLRMPNGKNDGLDVLKKIKETQPDTQVIIITAHDSTKDLLESLNFHAFGYIIKLDPNNLDWRTNITQKVKDAFEYYEYITGKTEYESISIKGPILSREELRESLKSSPSLSEYSIKLRYEEAG